LPLVPVLKILFCKVFSKFVLAVLVIDTYLSDKAFKINSLSSLFSIPVAAAIVFISLFFNVFKSKFNNSLANYS